MTRLPWEPAPPEPEPNEGGELVAPYALGRGRGYAETALESELERVQSASNGTRNHTLNRAAFSLGQLVAGGELDRARVEQELATAAQLVGLGNAEIAATIRSGLDGGAKHPRNTPPPRHTSSGGFSQVNGNHSSNHGNHGDPPEGSEESESETELWMQRAVAGGSFVLDAPSTPPAVWGEGQEVLWAEGEALMLCGPAGVGKTTLTIQVLAARLGIGAPEVLGLPVAPGRGKVLYLAMDRPPQIARAMGRVFSEADRQILDEKLVVWKGPPPHDLAKRSDVLLKMCQLFGADTVVVDSLKDAVAKLSDDESGGGYNKARQRALLAGVQVLEMHHQRKAGGDNKKPSKLDDVYGSTWLTAGAGSVALLWGEPGDPVVELTHLKQPAEPLGPWMVEHDHTAGRSQILDQTDLVELARQQGQVGLTVQVAAQQLFMVDKPGRSELEKARRKLKSLATSGRLVERELSKPGGGKPESRWFLSGPAVV